MKDLSSSTRTTQSVGRTSHLRNLGRQPWNSVITWTGAFFTGRTRRQVATSEPDKKHEIRHDLFDQVFLGQETLSNVSGEIEKCFLAIGSSLEKLPAISESLVSQSERLLSLATGRESGVATFDTTMSLLEDPLSFIDRCQTHLQDLIARLETSSAEIEKLVSSEALLNRAVAPLTYIQINFKIESAPLSHAVQQMFLALTEDVERLHRQVSQTFGQKFADLRQTQVTIKNVTARLRKDAENQGRSLRKKRAEVSKALAELQADLKQNEGRDILLTHISKAIDQQVGKLVMVLQSQDIASQRLAHAMHAIGEIQQRHQLARTGSNGGEIYDPLAFCEVSSRLQEAQLASIEDELKQADEGIRKAIQQISEQIVQLDRECLSLTEFDRVTAGMDGLVQVLLDTIQEVRQMAHNAVDMADQAYQALRPIGGLASNLTGVMRDLSAQIHLIALNAQVQAAHNCGGTGLEVLAQGTASISNEARAISEKVARGVDSLTVELDHLVESLLRIREEGIQKRDLMENEARNQEQGLHAMRDETLNALTMVSDCIQQISAHVTSMQKQNALQAIIADNFDSLRTNLLAAANDAKTILDGTGQPQDRQRFSADLAKHYTVASEHAVHRSIFGTTQAAAPKAASPTPATADVFLFDDLSPDASPAQAAPVENEGTTETTASNGAPATDGPSAATDAVKKDPTLGDNVDLF